MLTATAFPKSTSPRLVASGASSRKRAVRTSRFLTQQSLPLPLRLLTRLFPLRLWLLAAKRLRQSDQIPRRGKPWVTTTLLMSTSLHLTVQRSFLHLVLALSSPSNPSSPLIPLILPLRRRLPQLFLFSVFLRNHQSVLHPRSSVRRHLLLLSLLHPSSSRYRSSVLNSKQPVSFWTANRLDLVRRWRLRRRSLNKSERHIKPISRHWRIGPSR